MEDKDILGKEFICCKFDSTDRLRFHDSYEDIIGCTSNVLSLHDEYKEYALVEITLKNGKKDTKYFPTEVIKQQIQERESRPIEYYFDNVRKILTTL
jgi:hypothetical protein